MVQLFRVWIRRKHNVILSDSITMLSLYGRDYQASNSMYDYVINHPGQFFLYDISCSWPTDPFRTYKDPPNNACFWGGWLWGSPLSHKQLETNGMTECFLTTMLEDDKYFIGSQQCAELLDDYYSSRHVDVRYEVVDKGDDWIIYSFSNHGDT